MEPLPHIIALLDRTRGSCFFTKLEPPVITNCCRGQRTVEDEFRSQLGQYKWNVVVFGHQGVS